MVTSPKGLRPKKDYAGETGRQTVDRNITLNFELTVELSSVQFSWKSE
jgi:hypothetical protein